jgi:hypothetical protein
MLDIFKTFGIPALFSLITAIIIKFVDRNQDKKAERNMKIFDKKRKAFTEILSQISKIIIYIKSQFSWDHNAFSVISENKCEEFQLSIENQILYLSEKDILTIRFITELLNTNSSWIYNVGSYDPDEFYCFNTKDLTIIEYLYNTLIKSFKDELFGIKKNNSSIDEIYLFKISFLLMNLIKNNDLIDKKQKENFVRFNYNENDVNSFLKKCNENKNELKLFCANIIDCLKRSEDLHEFDKMRIEELIKYKVFIK